MIAALAYLLAMACWEVYDQHPDHLAMYGLIGLVWLYKAVHRDSNVPVGGRRT